MTDDGQGLVEWATADRERRYRRRLKVYRAAFWGLLLLMLPSFYVGLFVVGVGCGAAALLVHFAAGRFFAEFSEEYVTPKEIVRAQVAGVQVPDHLRSEHL